MIRVILILAVLGFLLWGLRWFMRTPPHEILQTLRGRGGLALMAALVLLAVLAHNWVVPMLGAAGALAARSLPYLPRLLPLLERLWQQRRAGQSHSQEGGAKSASSAMPSSLEEAYQILGLEPGASKEEIIAAHRRLMQKVHPDRGGSDYLAAQINRAKEILLDAQK